MDQYNLTISRLDGFIEQSIRLEKLGFTSKVAEILASELAEKGLNPNIAAVNLANLLSQGASLEDAAAKLRAERNRLQIDVETKRTQKEGYARQLETLENQIKEFKHVFEQEKKIYDLKLNQLEKKYTSEQDMFKTKLEGEKARLKTEIKDLENKLATVTEKTREIKEEYEAAQMKIGEAQTALKKIDEKIVKIKPLATFVSLVEESTSQLEQTTLLKVSIAFLEGLKTYIEEYSQSIPSSLALKRQLEKLNQTLSVELNLATLKVK